MSTLCGFLNALLAVLGLLIRSMASHLRREIELSKMLHVVGEYLSDMNAGSKKPQNLVLFQFALEHVARISAVVSQPGGASMHALLKHHY